MVIPLSVRYCAIEMTDMIYSCLVGCFVCCRFSVQGDIVISHNGMNKVFCIFSITHNPLTPWNPLQLSALCVLRALDLLTFLFF